jgi:hypothetical protein
VRIESVTVKLLRSGRQYSNDTIELRAQLDEGEDWQAVENELRHEGAAAIRRHWREVEAREREEERAEEMARVARRDELTKAWLGNREKGGHPCPPYCSPRYWPHGCDSCPAESERKARQAAPAENNDIPFDRDECDEMGTD